MKELSSPSVGCRCRGTSSPLRMTGGREESDSSRIAGCRCMGMSLSLPGSKERRESISVEGSEEGQRAVISSTRSAARSGDCHRPRLFEDLSPKLCLAAASVGLLIGLRVPQITLRRFLQDRKCFMRDHVV